MIGIYPARKKVEKEPSRSDFSSENLHSSTVKSRVIKYFTFPPLMSTGQIVT